MLMLIPSLRLFQNGQGSLNSNLWRTAFNEKVGGEPLLHFSQLLVRNLNQPFSQAYIVLFRYGNIVFTSFRTDVRHLKKCSSLQSVRRIIIPDVISSEV